MRRGDRGRDRADMSIFRAHSPPAAGTCPGSVRRTPLGRSRRTAQALHRSTRSRLRGTSTAGRLRGRVTLDNEPKTTRSRRYVPVARSVMRRLEQHLAEFADRLQMLLC